jgi:MSHA pilin protein MshD
MSLRPEPRLQPPATATGPRRGLRGHRRAQGFTLIDVLVMIVMLGVVAGSMTVLFSRLAAQSVQSLRETQAQALAQGLLAEVMAAPFTFCDPQDARVRLANAAVVGGLGCASLVEGLGPEAGESRYGTGIATRLDNVSDYQGLTMPGPGCAGGLCSPAGTLLNPPGTPLAGCSAAVLMAAVALPGIAALDASGRPQVLRISVRVACPGRADTLAEGLRVRHAPLEP